MYISFPSSSNNVPKPQYSIIRDPVDGELPEFLVCEVQLPLVVSEQQPLDSVCDSISKNNGSLYTNSCIVVVVVVVHSPPPHAHTHMHNIRTTHTHTHTQKQKKQTNKQTNRNPLSR